MHPPARSRCLTAVGFVASAVLSACAVPDPNGLRADLGACQADAARIVAGDYDPRVMRLVDECMVRKGWKADRSCDETAARGTGFCNYVK